MKILIILNGELKSGIFLASLAKTCDYVICADGGYDKAAAAGVIPDLLIGDMDSVQNRTFTGEQIQFPAEKNWTDCELAIETALERGADEIILTCTQGGRCDHAVANLYILSRYKNVCIRETDCSVYVCADTMELTGQVGKTISIIPVCETVATLSGFKYPAKHSVFEIGSTLGISNIVTEQTANIIIEHGKALIFINE